jgi:hypothetical protein
VLAHLRLLDRRTNHCFTKPRRRAQQVPRTHTQRQKPGAANRAPWLERRPPGLLTRRLVIRSSFTDTLPTRALNPPPPLRMSRLRRERTLGVTVGLAAERDLDLRERVDAAGNAAKQRDLFVVPRCFRWVADLARGSHRPPCLWGPATRPPDQQAGTPTATPTRGTHCPPAQDCTGIRECLSPDLLTQNSEEPHFCAPRLRRVCSGPGRAGVRKNPDFLSRR